MLHMSVQNTNVLWVQQHSNCFLTSYNHVHQLSNLYCLYLAASAQMCTCADVYLELFGSFFHWVVAIYFKVTDKVRSIDCLNYSHQVCRSWAVKLWSRDRGNSDTLKASREHLPAEHLLAARAAMLHTLIYAVCCHACVHQDLCVCLLFKCLLFSSPFYKHINRY